MTKNGQFFMANSALTNRHFRHIYCHSPVLSIVWPKDKFLISLKMAMGRLLLTYFNLNLAKQASFTLKRL